MKFARMITLYRREKKISLRRLGRELDLNFHTLHKIEGGCLPTTKNMLKLLVWALSE